MDYLERFRLLEDDLSTNRVLQLSRFEMPMAENSTMNHEKINLLEESIVSFYKVFKLVRIQWEASIFDDPDVAGEVNILPLERALRDWKNDIYFEDHDIQDPKRFYHPLDFFIPEASVGIILQDDRTSEVFFFDYGEELIALELNFEGYIHLLLEARGFFYWQMSLISLISGGDFEESERFKEFMPKIFPAFKFSEFERLYMNHRLD